MSKNAQHTPGPLTMSEEREHVLRSETKWPSHGSCPDNWADCNWAREAAVEFAAELDATRAQRDELLAVLEVAPHALGDRAMGREWQCGCPFCRMARTAIAKARGGAA